MSASPFNAGSRFFRFCTRSVWVSFTRAVAVSLKVPSRTSAVVSAVAAPDQDVERRGSSLSTRSIASVCPANVPESRFSDWIEATMLSRCASSTPTKSSRRISRSRTSLSRPASAVLKLWMMSLI